MRGGGCCCCCSCSRSAPPTRLHKHDVTHRSRARIPETIFRQATHRATDRAASTGEWAELSSIAGAI